MLKYGYSLKELLEWEEVKGKYADIEVNLYNKYSEDEYVEQGQGYSDYEVREWDLMDEETYNAEILRGSDVTVDFEEIYGDKNAKCLVVLLENPQYVLRTDPTSYDEDEIEEVKDYFISGVEDEEQDEKYEEYCREVKECTTLKELYDVLMKYDDYSNAGAYDLKLVDINK